MIFRRALLQELTQTALAVFSVLLAITFTTLLVRLLGQAASGAAAAGAVTAFLGFSILNYLPVLLSLTLFIAVLLVMTRSYRESEMVVWLTSGLGLAAWARPVLYFAAPVAVTIAVLSFGLSPWALKKSDELTRQIESRDDVSTIAPGVFKESRQADRVYFVESFAGQQGTVRNIFVQSLQNGTLGIMVAQHGYLTTAPNGDRFLVLLNGRRYEGRPGSPEYKILEFERYAMRIEPYEAKRGTLSAKSASTVQLLGNKTPDNVAELEWRLGLPLSALVLALMAIPLSAVNPRAGRSLNLVLALFIYMTYSNLLSISQVWVAQQKISPAAGLWAVHGFMVLIMLVLFYRRIYSAVRSRFAPRRKGVAQGPRT